MEPGIVALLCVGGILVIVVLQIFFRNLKLDYGACRKGFKYDRYSSRCEPVSGPSRRRKSGLNWDAGAYY